MMPNLFSDITDNEYQFETRNKLENCVEENATSLSLLIMKK
jgi:hypothetical protein